MTRSLLYQDSGTAHVAPPGCALGERQEVAVSLRRGGRRYTFKLRDKTNIDDLYAVGVKAAAFAIRQAEPFAGRSPDRGVKDFLLKLDVVV